MKKLILAFCCTLTIIGCKQKEENPSWNIPQNDAIVGLGIPIQLNFDSTKIYFSDFIITPEIIDSVKSPKGLKKVIVANENAVWLIGSQTEPMSVFTFYAGEYSYDVPVKKSEKQKVEFKFPTKNTYQSVQIGGSMNGWAQSKNPLTLNNGVWETSFILNPGEYEYKLSLDGEMVLDPSNNDSIDNGQGDYNSVLKVGDYKVNPPKMYSKSFADGIVVISNSGVSNIFAYWQNHLIPAQNISINNAEIEINLPQEINSFEKGVLRVFGYGKNGISNDLYIPFFNGQVVSKPSQLTREEKHKFIMYFMMIDRFKDGDSENNHPLNLPEVNPKADYYGGDMAGITQKIEDGYFTDLGVNTIWLSPIVQNPLGPYGQYPNPKTQFSGYHGYWPISSSKVDFRFGNESVFKDLIEKSHNQNINILVDYVANHVHQEHPVYKQHPVWATDLYLPDGTENTQKWDEYRLTTWFDTFMPSLDFSKPEVVDAMTDSALFWFENYPIDGFRHDATKHIPEEFWRALTFKLKKRVIEPQDRNIYQIGETYGNAELISSYVSSGQLDAQFDFNVYDAAIAVFATPEIPATRLADKLKESLKYYGNHNLMGYITGNQDRARFISYADGSVKFSEDAKLAGWIRKIELKNPEAYKNLAMLHTFNLTIPGIPVIYYGDEIGMVGGNDPDNRRMMVFENLSENQTQLKDYVSNLCKLRTNNLALIYGDLQFLHESENVLVFSRKFFEEEVIVVFNKSSESQTINLSKPSFLNGGIYVNAFSNEQFQFDTSLELEPLSTYVFTKN